jgi:hypothetical protein
LFGRPLKQTLRNFGLKVLQKEKKTIEFLKDGKSSPFF